MKKLQNLIEAFANQSMNGHKRSTRKVYVQFLHDFAVFQHNQAGSENGWQTSRKKASFWHGYVIRAHMSVKRRWDFIFVS